MLDSEIGALEQVIDQPIRARSKTNTIQGSFPYVASKIMVEVKAKPLTIQGASAHGLQVITIPDSPSAAQQGNQGTALVARKLTSFPSHYSSAPSGKPSSCNTAYFRCAPRETFRDDKGRTVLEVKVFERHPYTRQAFFPMGSDARQKAYVVIVARDKGTDLSHVS